MPNGALRSFAVPIRTPNWRTHNSGSPEHYGFFQLASAQDPSGTRWPWTANSANAAKSGDVDSLRRLLNSHPEKLELAIPPNGQSLLHLAATSDHLAAVDLLLERGLEVTGWATRFGSCHVEVADILIVARRPAARPLRDFAEPSR